MPTAALPVLCSLFLHDGVLVYARRGVKVDKAIQIVNITSVAMPVLNIRRVVVIAEDDADIKVLLCDHLQAAGVQTLDSEVVTVEVGEGARVELLRHRGDSSAKPTLLAAIRSAGFALTPLGRLFLHYMAAVRATNTASMWRVTMPAQS